MSATSRTSGTEHRAASRAQLDAAPRDSRAVAPVVAMDLSRSTDEIHRDLRTRFPTHPTLWWELEENERSGWVYKSNSSILCKLVHTKVER